VPARLEESHIRKTLLAEFGIEIGGGLGPLAGKVWRIGLMGESSRQEHVMALLSALEQVMGRQTGRKATGAALTAAVQSYATCS
jgi:alanine-glyoxylate transaminase/serine-glyoxylate transaminase/serine-pyruvate transaminase